MPKNIDLGRRGLVLGAAAAGVATAANAQVRTDTAPRILNGQTMPEPIPIRVQVLSGPGVGHSLPIRWR